MGMRYRFPKKRLSRDELETLIDKVNKRDGKFTNNEIMCFPLGTQVKIKQSALIEEKLKGEGALVFQEPKDLNDDDRGEHLFGVLFKDCVCFHFRAVDYEIVSLETVRVPPFK